MSRCRLAIRIVFLSFAGCAVGGEEGREPPLERVLPDFGEEPTREEALRYAFHSDPGIRQAFAKWSRAVHRIPGTPPAALTPFSFDHLFSLEMVRRWNRTTLEVPRRIPFPRRLEAPGREALQAAAAARRRLEESKFRLQAEVLCAYEELTLTDRAIRIGIADLELLRQGGTLMTARAEEELSSHRSRRSADLARLNQLLSRPPEAVLRPRAATGEPAFPASDAELLDVAAARNPGIKAWLPEIDLTFDGRELLERVVGPMLTRPLETNRLLAGLQEAQAGLRAAQAALRIRTDDDPGRVRLNLYLFRDSDRQVRVFRTLLIPKVRELVDAALESCDQERTTLPDLLEARRSMLMLELGEARLDAVRRQAAARLEALCGLDFGA